MHAVGASATPEHHPWGCFPGSAFRLPAFCGNAIACAPELKYNEEMSQQDEPPPVLIPDGPKLSLKEKKAEAPPPVDRHRAVDKRAAKKKRRKRPAKKKKVMSAFLESFFALLFVGALGGGLIYHRVTGQDLLPLYAVNLVSASLVLAFYVVILIESFTQDMLQGILCLFIPPYALIYGLFFSDAGPLKGFTLGLILFLGAEMFFVPNDALVNRGTETVSNWVGSLQALIGGERREAGFQ